MFLTTSHFLRENKRREWKRKRQKKRLVERLKAGECVSSQRYAMIYIYRDNRGASVWKKKTFEM